MIEVVCCAHSPTLAKALAWNGRRGRFNMASQARVSTFEEMTG